MRIAAPSPAECKTALGPTLSPSGRPPSPAFADEFVTQLHAVNDLQQQAEDSMRAGALKGATGIHETMIKLEEADLSMRLLVKVRNKALEAYQEIMRMQF